MRTTRPGERFPLPPEARWNLGAFNSAVRYGFGALTPTNPSDFFRIYPSYQVPAEYLQNYGLRGARTVKAISAKKSQEGSQELVANGKGKHAAVPKAPGAARPDKQASGGSDPRSFERPPGPTALVMGSEAFGLSEADQELLDGSLTLPMAPGVDSYSINACAAVLLWELARG